MPFSSRFSPGRQFHHFLENVAVPPLCVLRVGHVTEKVSGKEKSGITPTFCLKISLYSVRIIPHRRGESNHNCEWGAGTLSLVAASVNKGSILKRRQSRFLPAPVSQACPAQALSWWILSHRGMRARLGCVHRGVHRPEKPGGSRAQKETGKRAPDCRCVQRLCVREKRGARLACKPGVRTLKRKSIDAEYRRKSICRRMQYMRVRGGVDAVLLCESSTRRSFRWRRQCEDVG
jgi:hypothetical protein